MNEVVTQLDSRAPDATVMIDRTDRTHPPRSDLLQTASVWGWVAHHLAARDEWKDPDSAHEHRHEPLFPLTGEPQ